MPAYQRWNRMFFPQTCKQVCASVRNIGFMFWGQSTLLEQKHNLNLRPSLGAYIQDLHSGPQNMLQALEINTTTTFGSQANAVDQLKLPCFGM